MHREPIGAEAAALLARYGLSPAALPQAAVWRFEKGDYLIREEEPLHTVFLVLSGRAKVMMSAASGKSLILSYFVSGGILGDLELFTGRENASTTVQAVTPLSCVALSRARCSDQLMENPAFLREAGRALAEKLETRGRSSALTVLHTLDARLSAYLVQTVSDGWLSEPLTDVAELLGASYRHLLRTLSRLVSEGALEKQGRRYRIRDRAALILLAEQEKSGAAR